MQIEAFSQGKDPTAPHANEDRFVILPGRAYAVIDGATAKTGARGQRARRVSKRSRNDPGIFLPRWLRRSRKPRLSGADRPRRAEIDRAVQRRLFHPGTR